MKNKIIKTQIIVMLFMILGKVIGFLREIILASKFGTTYEMDTYSFNSTLLLFLATIGYAITTTVIPLFTELKDKEKFKEQERIVNNLISCVFIMGIAITIMSIVLSNVIVVLFAPGFTGESFITARNLTIIMSFSIIFMLIQSVITGVLQANGKFYTPAAMALIGNIVMLIYLLFFVSKFGIIGFGYITVLAYFMQLLINIPSYKKLGFKYYFYMNIKDEKIRTILRLSISVIASTCIMQVATFINNFYGSLIGEGSISIYNYANRLITLGIEIVPIGISMVIYPILSKMGSNKNEKEFNRIFKEGITLISIVIIPITILMIILRVDIIKFLYERNSFTSESTLVTSKMLLFLAPVMLSGGIKDLLNKACYSLNEVKIPMRVSILTIIITILVNLLLYKKIGISSLGIATSVANVLGAILTIVLVKKKFKFVNLNVSGSLIKISIASVLMGVIVYVTKGYLAIKLGTSMLGTLGLLIISAIISIFIYMILLIILNVREFKVLLNNKKYKL